MAQAFDVCSQLERALNVDASEKQAVWRARIRHIFADVDGSELLACAKNQRGNLYAALVKREPSSMYSVRLRPSPTGQERMMDIGVVRDPEWFGDPQSDVGGLLLWVSSDYEDPFIELIAHLGFADIGSFPLDDGTAIDLKGQISNDDLCDLARLAVVELVAAFDVSGKEWADQDRFALAQAIRADYAGGKQQTL